MIRRKKTGGVNPLVQLVVLLVAIALLGLLGYRQYVRMGHAKKPVVVAAAALPEGAVIQPQHVQVIALQEKNIPEGAFLRASDVIGRKLTQAKAKGEPFAAGEMAQADAESTKQLSRAIPEGRVLTSLTLLNPTIPVRSLVRGDRVDIVAAGTQADKTRGAQTIAHDVYVMGYVPPQNGHDRPSKNLLGLDLSVPTLDDLNGKKDDKTTLLVAVNPLDAKKLAQVDGIQDLRLVLVLHGDAEVKKGEMLAIDHPSRPLKTVDIILGAKSEKVSVP